MIPFGAYPSQIPHYEWPESSPDRGVLRRMPHDLLASARGCRGLLEAHPDTLTRSARRWPVHARRMRGFVVCPLVDLPLHSYPLCDIGTRKLTLVPCPTSLVTASLPPRAAARSRMLFSPTPGVVSGSKPRPSSEISITRPSWSGRSITRTLRAPE